MITATTKKVTTHRPRVEHSNHDLLRGDAPTRRMELVGVRVELMSDGSVRLDIPVTEGSKEAHKSAVAMFREMGLDKYEAELAYVRVEDSLIAKALQRCVV